MPTSGNHKMTLNFETSGRGAHRADGEVPSELIYPQPPKLPAASGWQCITESLTADGCRKQEVLPAEDTSTWSFSAPGEDALADAPPPSGDPVNPDVLATPKPMWGSAEADGRTAAGVLAAPDSSFDVAAAGSVEVQPAGNVPAELGQGQMGQDGAISADTPPGSYVRSQPDSTGVKPTQTSSVLVTGKRIFGGHTRDEENHPPVSSADEGESATAKRGLEAVQEQLLAERPELLTREERQQLLVGLPPKPDVTSESSVIDVRDKPFTPVPESPSVDADLAASDEVQVVTVPIMQPANPLTRDPAVDSDLDHRYVFPRKAPKTKADLGAGAAVVGPTPSDAADGPASQQVASSRAEMPNLRLSLDWLESHDVEAAPAAAEAGSSAAESAVVDAEPATHESGDVVGKPAARLLVDQDGVDMHEVDTTAKRKPRPPFALVPPVAEPDPESQIVQIDLSHVAPLEPAPQELLDRVLDQAAKLKKYPQLSSPKVDLALRYRVRPDQILLSDTLAQSRAVVVRLFEHFDCRRVLVAGPYLNVWEDHLSKNGYHVELLEEDEIACPGWSETTTQQRILDAAEPTVVILSNPNRFNGRPYSTEMLIDLATKHQLLVVDETLMPFAADRHCDATLVRLPNVVVIRNVARPWHTPGLEGTCYVGAAELLQLPAIQEISNEASSLMAAACDVYTSREARVAQRETVDAMMSLAADLHFKLSRLVEQDGRFRLESPTGMPFVLAAIKNGREDWQDLAKRGWVVRTCEDVAHLGPDWARICVHSNSVHTDFVAAVEQQLQQGTQVSELA